MIKSLKATASFELSGALLSVDFQPENGITAVVGRNGTGKTFTGIELPRWLLFGKAALRGKASDYKNTEAEGVFVIRGAEYTIHRGKSEWIKDANGDKIAVGAEAVTARVTDLIGYGLSVFDICNAALQGEVQRLGNSLPSERKAMIDKVLRLTDTEKTEKDCRAEATKYRMKAEYALSLMPKLGEKPVKPNDYVPSEQLVSELAEKRALRDKAESYRSQIVAVSPPTKPSCSEPTNRAELEEHERQRVLIDAQYAALPDRADYTDAQLDAAELRLRGPKPELTRQQIDEGFDLLRRWKQYESVETVECPKCSNVFRTSGEEPEPIDYGHDYLVEQEQRLRKWEGQSLDVAIPEGPDLSATRIAQERQNILWVKSREALPPKPLDRQQELADARQAEAEWTSYRKDLARFEQLSAASRQASEALALLGPLPSTAVLDDLADRVAVSRKYEQEQEAYVGDELKIVELQAEVAEQTRLADEFKAGAADLAEARAAIKTQLAPKISTVASSLIYDMTNGELKNVVVDEDMEITVNGQPFNTLSGAGKTVANIALRVAMGLALVANAFPVFLADEIDGDLDEERRPATMEAIAALRTKLKQVILITHRDVSIADHVKVTG